MDFSTVFASSAVARAPCLGEDELSDAGDVLSGTDCVGGVVSLATFHAVDGVDSATVGAWVASFLEREDWPESSASLSAVERFVGSLLVELSRQFVLPMQWFGTLAMLKLLPLEDPVPVHRSAALDVMRTFYLRCSGTSSFECPCPLPPGVGCCELEQCGIAILQHRLATRLEKLGELQLSDLSGWNRVQWVSFCLWSDLQSLLVLADAFCVGVLIDFVQRVEDDFGSRVEVAFSSGFLGF